MSLKELRSYRIRINLMLIVAVIALFAAPSEEQDALLIPLVWLPFLPFPLPLPPRPFGFASGVFADSLDSHAQVPCSSVLGIYGIDLWLLFRRFFLSMRHLNLIHLLALNLSSGGGDSWQMDSESGVY